MGQSALQIIVLAAIAIFLIFRLRSVLGTRDGFEPKLDAPPSDTSKSKTDRKFEVIDGGLDRDITDHVEMNSLSGQALVDMKALEADFSVNGFLDGAKQAYEIILMAFEKGDTETLKEFLSDEVYELFENVIKTRKSSGYTVNANFVGVREMKLTSAVFDDRTKVAEVTLKFVGELVSYVEDADGKIIEGNRDVIKRQTDVWTFARKFGSDDPNWELIATGG